MTGKVRRNPGEGRGLEESDDGRDEPSVRKFESIDRIVEHNPYNKKALYQAALEERSNAQSAALPPISNKNRNIQKQKRDAHVEKDNGFGPNNKRSQMNILSSSGYRVMNMDSRQDPLNDTGVLNSDYHLSK